MARKYPKTHVEPGEFPFPITGGKEESRYLTWVRNHSNYMGVRGFLDYARAAGVILRGIFINSLVFMPILMAIAIGVAAANLFLDSFGVSIYVLGFALLSVLAFPLLTPLFKIVRFRRRLATGTDSSVKMRDVFERWFGGILLLILAAVGFESLSYFLGDFHQLRRDGEFGASHMVSITSVAAVLMTGAGKVLTLAPGLVRKLAMAVIALLGLLVPLLGILYVADFLVFSPPSLEWSAWIYLALGILFGLILSALLLGLFFGFSFKDVLKTLLMLTVIGIAGFGLLGADWKAYTLKADFDEKLHAALDQLGEVTELTARGDNLKFDGQRFNQYLGEGVRPKKIEVDMNRLVADVDAQLSLPADPPKYLNELAEFIEFNRAWKADYLAGRKLAASPPELVEGRHDVLVQLADAAFLPNLLNVGLAPGPTDSSDPEWENSFQTLIEMASAVPTEIFARQSTAQLVDTLLAVSLEDIHAIMGNYYDCLGEDQCGPIPSYVDNPNSGDNADSFINSSENSLEHNMPDTMHVLTQLGNLLFKARTELAILALYSKSKYPEIYNMSVAAEVHRAGFLVKSLLLALLAAILFWLVWLTVDVNLTSIHGLYRDRLASAFLVGIDSSGDIDIEKDLDLVEICCHEAGSIAPYHLINVALNLQGSSDIGVRDRKSDFFIFSKRFIGGNRTGFCRSESMETVFPQMGLSSAMAISAAAASPNMGRGTSPDLVAIMTLLNIRLGYWIPNPGKLETWLSKRTRETDRSGAYDFNEVFAEELMEIRKRWEQLPSGSQRKLSEGHLGAPAPEHGLVGVGYSGGGIRSATLNLGITQVLHQRGLFDHVDYMSTVSGGGYLGSSISALMRRKTRTFSEIQGQVSLEQDEGGDKVISISRQSKSGEESRQYRFSNYADIALTHGKQVKKGRRMIHAGQPILKKLASLGSIFHWRVRPGALLREVSSKLSENNRWVNVSDGGHIENLASIELIRRRCRYIIIGDGEADPNHHFNGLATLVRSARIDLGVHIEIDLADLRLSSKSRTSKSHFAIGRVHYPESPESPGYLLYLKSSLTGEEDEVIKEYRFAHPTFPHESTADQFFSEGQFEAYRSLGQHIAESALAESGYVGGGMSYDDMETWFRAMHEKAKA